MATIVRVKAPGEAWNNAVEPTGGGGGGGSSFPIIVVCNLALTNVVAPELFQAVVPNTLKGDGTTSGIGANALFTSAFGDFAAGNVIVGGGLNDLEVATSGIVVLTSDALDLFLNAYVTDVAGTNKATVTGTAAVASPVTDTAAVLNLAGLTWTITAGTDLTSDANGKLTTTAGGRFQVSVGYRVGWD